MKLSSPTIKNVIIFTQKKFFFYFGEWNFLKKLLIFQEGTFRARKIKKSGLKKCLIFREMELSSSSLKTLYIFSEKKFLYFRRKLAKPEKQKFLMFREKYL